MYCEIELTQGYKTIVDSTDYSLLSQWKWYYKDGYAVRNGMSSSGKRTTIRMHRVIMNVPDDLQVDHKNRDRLDNRRDNLRICTHDENVKNLSKQKGDYTSLYRGVSFDKSKGLWVLAISKKFVCYFTNEIATANSYNYFSKILHKDFSNPNDVKYMSIEEWSKFIYTNDLIKTSKCRGVYYNSKIDKWCSQFRNNGYTYYLGSFNSEKDAYVEYCKKNIEVNGVKLSLVSNMLATFPDLVNKFFFQVPSSANSK